MSGKRLSEKERNDIARRIAAGESYPTIAERVGCSIQNVKYYAAKIRPKVEAIIVAGREARTVDAIGAGLREKDGRVDELIWMYGEVKADLSDGLYGTDTKISATGKTVQVPVFKAPQITQARGLLDDIAKEEGGRKTGVEHSGTLTFAGLAELAAQHQPGAGAHDPDEGEAES
jgi:hypothetical protein